MSESALLQAIDLRIDVAGVATVDGLNLTASGTRVLVLGGPSAFFEAACGVAPVARGSLLVAGERAQDALRKNKIAGVPLDAPMPPRWTVREYATWSARLAGRGKKEAEDRADEAISNLGITMLARTALGRSHLFTRRAAAFAAALATGAETLLFENPIGDLDDASRRFADTLLGAMDSLSWIAFSARTSLTSPLASLADKLVLLDASRVRAEGTATELAAQCRSCAVQIDGPTALIHAFTARVGQTGARIEQRGGFLCIDLPAALSKGDLFALAAESGARIVELRPIDRAFA